MTVAERSWTVWSTYAHLLTTAADALPAAVAIAERRLAAVGGACDRFRPDSELSGIEDASQGVRVSPLLADLVRTALDAAARTDGAVDPTVGAAIVAAGYDRDIALLPDDDRTGQASVADVPGWRRVHLDGDLLTIPAGLRLDLGATAKAFAADLIAAETAAEIGAGVLVNLGGDLATAGPAPDRGWQVTVQDAPGDPATQVALAGGWALATSSTRRRRWSVGGEIRHHILDPATGRSAQPVWRTVSVAASSAVLANTYSTMAIVRGPDALATLAETGWPARLVDDVGAVRVVGGWPDDVVPQVA